MDIGDAILINGMGAYTVGPVSKFNGMDVEEKVLVVEQQRTEAFGQVALDVKA